MDSTLLRPGLHEFLAEVKTAIQQRNAERLKLGEPNPYLPLVADEQLYFQIEPRVAADRYTKASQIFPEVYTGLWSHIPATDHQIMRNYWTSQQWPVMADDWESAPPHRPLIQLTDNESSTCARSGLALGFPLSLVDEPERLADEIAMMLAHVFRLATSHWRLYLTMVEKPLARWEKRHKTKISHWAHKKKAKSLEKEYLQKYDAEMNEVLSRWGSPAKSVNGKLP